MCRSPLRIGGILVFRELFGGFGTDFPCNQFRFAVDGLNLFFLVRATQSLSLFLISVFVFTAFGHISGINQVNFGHDTVIGIYGRRRFGLGNFKSLNRPAGNSGPQVIIGRIFIAYRTAGPDFFRIVIIPS